jgi:DNA-binding transcriptional LysR family regulator
VPDLQQHPLILFQSHGGNDVNTPLNNTLQGLCKKSNVVARVLSIDVMLVMVEAGYGAGVLRTSKASYFRGTNVIVKPH